MLAALNISPSLYFDLTGTETAALMKGVANRRLERLRETRIIATLLRNAHFKGLISETDFMPLPGDENFQQTTSQSPEALMAALAGAMGVSVEIIEHGT